MKLGLFFKKKIGMPIIFHTLVSYVAHVGAMKFQFPCSVIFFLQFLWIVFSQVCFYLKSDENYVSTVIIGKPILFKDQY